MAAETVRVWVSKYALTKGIFRARVEREAGDEYAYERKPYAWHQYHMYLDAHETREAAVADAEVRRQRKIASLKRQIAKLEAMTFAEVESAKVRDDQAG